MSTPRHTVRSRGYLPHWEAPGATYSVTFRLNDSLPKHVLDAYLRERRDIIETAAAMGRKLTDQEEERLADLFSERIDGYLDRGEGGCHLQRPDVGDMVCSALTYYHTVRYDILRLVRDAEPCASVIYTARVAHAGVDHEQPEIFHGA
jgi:menaquinone-specific isochorismate synthase